MTELIEHFAAPSNNLSISRVGSLLLACMLASACDDANPSVIGTDDTGDADVETGEDGEDQASGGADGTGDVDSGADTGASKSVSSDDSEDSADSESEVEDASTGGDGGTDTSASGETDSGVSDESTSDTSGETTGETSETTGAETDADDGTSATQDAGESADDTGESSEESGDDPVCPDLTGTWNVDPCGQFVGGTCEFEQMADCSFAGTCDDPRDTKFTGRTAIDQSMQLQSGPTRCEAIVSEAGDGFEGPCSHEGNVVCTLRGSKSR